MTMNEKIISAQHEVDVVDGKIHDIIEQLNTTLADFKKTPVEGRNALIGRYSRLMQVWDSLEGERITAGRHLAYAYSLKFTGNMEHYDEE